MTGSEWHVSYRKGEKNLFRRFETKKEAMTYAKRLQFEPGIIHVLVQHLVKIDRDKWLPYWNAIESIKVGWE